MRLTIIQPDRIAGYSRDCFEGIDDPLNLEGQEVDVFAVMARALLFLPTAKGAEFHADEDAMAMIRRQSVLDRNKLRGRP